MIPKKVAFMFQIQRLIGVLIRIYDFVEYLIVSSDLDDKNVRFFATYFHCLIILIPFS